jgi:NAD(P)-dependent dehydrogenase (short-subunit alcohol dehydrogenase family)/uncharacterized OB-fold protein
MTTPLERPKRKDPLERTVLPTLPPAGRSREALGLISVAGQAQFQLQTCTACGAVQYPPRQLCHKCLGPELPWAAQPEGGTLLAETTLHHSNDVYFRERLPWRLGLVQLDCGPSVVAHVMEDCAPGSRVRMSIKLDRANRAVMLAMPPEDTPHMDDDAQLRQTTCDPKLRRVLITNAKTAAGIGIANAMLAAGARTLFLGDADPWKRRAEFDELAARAEVEVFKLDVTNSESVHEVAGQIGAKVDILVNSNYYIRPGGIMGRKDVNNSRNEMDVNYLGLLRLATEFGPVMRARGADGDFSACAWVNVLSIYAMVNNPALSTYSASQAAALSLAQGLRTELAQGGVKLMNVFPGPIEDEWQQLFPPPKVAPEALARAIIDGLKRGAEDIYPGTVAEETIARLRENPKEVERELNL